MGAARSCPAAKGGSASFLNQTRPECDRPEYGRPGSGQKISKGPEGMDWCEPQVEEGRKGLQDTVWEERFPGTWGQADCGVEFCAACVSQCRRQTGHSGACGGWGFEQITIMPGPSLHLETRDDSAYLQAGWKVLMK